MAYKLARCSKCGNDLDIPEVYLVSLPILLCESCTHKLVARGKLPLAYSQKASIHGFVMLTEDSYDEHGNCIFIH